MITEKQLLKYCRVMGYEVEVCVKQDSLEDGHPFSCRIVHVGVNKGNGTSLRSTKIVRRYVHAWRYIIKILVLLIGVDESFGILKGK